MTKQQEKKGMMRVNILSFSIVAFIIFGVIFFNFKVGFSVFENLSEVSFTVFNFLLLIYVIVIILIVFIVFIVKYIKQKNQIKKEEEI